jgi:hypothetical protein
LDPVAITPDDDAFLNAFHTGAIRGFHHRDHLRLAWIHIKRLGFEAASGAVTKALRGFAQHHGDPDRYNDTMTRFWLRAVAIAIGRHPDLSFDALIGAEPHLLDKSLPFKHWSREQLTAGNAKASWVEPDLRPLPIG